MNLKMSLMQNHMKKVVRGIVSTQLRFQQTQARSIEKEKIVKAEPFVPVKTPAFRNVKNFAKSVALRDDVHNYTYANIFISAKKLAAEISSKLDGKTNERVLFLCPNDVNYLVTLWAIWMSGQIAVPLSPLHPQNLLLYYANDTNAALLITTKAYTEVIHQVAKNIHANVFVLDDKLQQNCIGNEHRTDADLEGGLHEQFYTNSNGMILYTSGTTGNPKGVVLSHSNINCQVNCLLDAWKWSPKDVILHTLPLHHVHGIVNALLCPLSIGAKTVMLPKFNANAVWQYLLGVNLSKTERKITVYMAVPTIYSKLIDEHQQIFSEDQKVLEHIRNTLRNKIRLMVSGSAPLPTSVFDKWLMISGHRLLERYGMTETGMALSNFYDDPAREPGYVGMPLPGTSVRIVESSSGKGETLLECKNENGNIIFDSPKPITDVTGELHVKGGSVFKGYYNRPEATKKDLTEDGWFKTGDVCRFSAEKHKMTILGRTSVDIIKSGGYKISALEVEAHLLANQDIAECCVVGLPDEKWGEKVAAIVVLRKGKSVTLDDLREFGADKIPKYALPSVLKIVDSIPKNVMGKINKKDLLKTVFTE